MVRRIYFDRAEGKVVMFLACMKKKKKIIALI
jgi:hypothetical protein